MPIVVHRCAADLHLNVGRRFARFDESTGLDHLSNARIVEAAHESARTGKTVRLM
jgi:hypothetical protein